MLKTLSDCQLKTVRSLDIYVRLSWMCREGERPISYGKLFVTSSRQWGPLFIVSQLAIIIIHSGLPNRCIEYLFNQHVAWVAYNEKFKTVDEKKFLRKRHPYCCSKMERSNPISRPFHQKRYQTQTKLLLWWALDGDRRKKSQDFSIQIKKIVCVLRAIRHTSNPGNYLFLI